MPAVGAGRCGAVLGCMDKPPCHSVAMPRHTSNFRAGVKLPWRVRRAHVTHDEALEEAVDQCRRSSSGHSCHPCVGLGHVSAGSID